jgi:hypothetical protein
MEAKPSSENGVVSNHKLSNEKNHKEDKIQKINSKESIPKEEAQEKQRKKSIFHFFKHSVDLVK